MPDELVTGQGIPSYWSGRDWWRGSHIWLAQPASAVRPPQRGGQLSAPGPRPSSCSSHTLCGTCATYTTHATSWLNFWIFTSIFFLCHIGITYLFVDGFNYVWFSLSFSLFENTRETSVLLPKPFDTSNTFPYFTFMIGKWKNFTYYGSIFLLHQGCQLCGWA